MMNTLRSKSSPPTFLSRHARPITAITIAFNLWIFLALIALELCTEKSQLCTRAVDFFAGLSMGLGIFIAPLAALLNIATLLLFFNGLLSRRMALVMICTWAIYSMPLVFGVLEILKIRFS